MSDNANAQHQFLMALTGDEVGSRMLPFFAPSINVEATKETLDIAKLCESLVCKAPGCKQNAAPISRYICSAGHVLCWDCAQIRFANYMGQCMVPLSDCVLPRDMVENTSQHYMTMADVPNQGDNDKIRNVEGTGQAPKEPSRRFLVNMMHKTCFGELRRCPLDPVYLTLLLESSWNCPQKCLMKIKGKDCQQHLSSGECKPPAQTVVKVEQETTE